MKKSNPTYIPLDLMKLELLPDLENLYRTTWKKHPWHEELACLSCKKQYSSKTCDLFDAFDDSDKIYNDCRDNFSRRNLKINYNEKDPL